MIVMSKKIDLDSCMTAAILLGDNLGDNPLENIELTDLATLDQLDDANTVCIECGGSGDIARSNYDHHYYSSGNIRIDGSEYLPPACIQAAGKKLEEIPPIVKAIGKWDEGNADEFPEFREIQKVFSGMLLSIKDAKEQAIAGIKLCQKWLKGDFLLSPEEEKWVERREQYDDQIENELEKVEFVDSMSDRTIAYVESPFWGTLREVQKRLDDDDIVIVRNPEKGKITVALNPQNSGDLKGICDLLNKIDPGWGGPITGKIIGSPQKGSRLTLHDVVQVVRLFM